MNRHLDYLVVKYIYKWQRVKVGPDVDGKNSCYIYTQDGKLPAFGVLPQYGKVSPGIMAPPYSDDLFLALMLAKHCGLNLNNLVLESNTIVRQCLKIKKIPVYWR